MRIELVFDFKNYKRNLLEKGVLLNPSVTRVSQIDGIPEQLFPLYENFNGMVEGSVEPEMWIEIYSINKAKIVTENHLKKFPELKNKLLYIFGDVLMESQYLAFLEDSFLPKFLFDNEFVDITDTDENLSTVWLELFSSAAS